jgi:hypothetical protein
MEKLDQEEADIISREATEEQSNRSKHAAPVEKGTDKSRNKDGGKQEEQR